MFLAQHCGTQLLITRLHLTAVSRVVKQPPPKGGDRLGVTTLINPILNIIRTIEGADTISEIIIPDRPCVQFIARAIRMKFFFIEIGTAAQAVGIEGELCMQEIVHKRRHIHISGITTVGIGKTR